MGLVVGSRGKALGARYGLSVSRHAWFPLVEQPFPRTRSFRTLTDGEQVPAVPSGKAGQACPPSEMSNRVLTAARTDWLLPGSVVRSLWAMQPPNELL